MQVQHPIIPIRRQVATDASQNKGFPDCALFHANLIYFPQFLTHWHLMASRVRLASSSWGHAKFGSRQPGASKWEYFFKPRVAHRTPVEDSFSEPIFFLREKSEPPALTNSRDQGVKRLMAWLFSVVERMFFLSFVECIYDYWWFDLSKMGFLLKPKMFKELLLHFSSRFSSLCFKNYPPQFSTNTY